LTISVQLWLSQPSMTNRPSNQQQPSMISPLVRWYDRKKTERSFLGQVLRKLRRFYLGTFRPTYIQKAAAANRVGDCRRCGLCCELIYKCPFLGKDSQNLSYCRIYGDLRPANCRNYPFDAVDAEIDQCGYSFKPDAPKTSRGSPF
jgi:hypothetical protein